MAGLSFEQRRNDGPVAAGTVIVTGPTASGKSDVAVALAQRIGGEIVSLDAFAVYRRMDIGTAKPSREQRSAANHHMIDVVDPDCRYSVQRYLESAGRICGEIFGRNRTPILCGGTPRYLRAVLRGFDPGPPADQAFRAAVQTDVDRYGSEALHRRLVQVDPISASNIDSTDVRRMTRALEVSYLTGIPMSHHQTHHDRPSELPPRAAVWLRWPRPQLHDRINRRTAAMFDAGLVDEVRGLIAEPSPEPSCKPLAGLSQTAAQAVGYREVIEFLNNECSLAECRERVAAHTRQLARRQETWFRGMSELTPIDITANLIADNDSIRADKIADRIESLFQSAR